MPDRYQLVDGIEFTVHAEGLLFDFDNSEHFVALTNAFINFFKRNAVRERVELTDSDAYQLYTHGKGIMSQSGEIYSIRNQRGYIREKNGTEEKTQILNAMQLSTYTWYIPDGDA